MTSVSNTNIFLNNSSDNLHQSAQLWILLLSFFLSCFCIITVLGNALVIYAVIQERYLKSGMLKRKGLQTERQSSSEGHSCERERY